MKKNKFLAIYRVLASITFLILPFIYGYTANIQAQICTPAPVGLVSWHSGDGNTLDSRSRNNGTLQNGATFSPGKVGQGFSFDGGNDYLQVNDNPALNFGTGDFSIEFWININGAQLSPNGDYGFINKNAYYQDAPGWGFELSTYSGNFPNPRIEFYETRTLWGLTNVVSPITVNTWHHVVAMRQGGDTNKLYIDGVLVASRTEGLFIAGNISNSQPLLLGAWSGTFFPGQLDEISIYNRALSANEVQTLYNADTNGKCKPTATVAPSGLVAFWSGDGNANDIVGGNNGTLSGGDFSYVGYGTDKVGQSLTFNGNYDGGSSRVTIPDSPSLDMVAAGTIETWINMNFVGNTSCSIISKGRFDNNQASYNLVLWNGHLRVDLYKGDGSGEYITIQIPAEPLWWNWIHVAITWDSTNLRLFLNGVQVGSTVYTFVRQDTNYPLYFGQSTPGYGSFSGYLDEVSFYNRDLTQDEITSIFNAGIAGKLKDNTTATGSNVAVSTNGDATVTFPTVITDGITQQIPLDLSLFPSLPSGSTTTGLTYDIATTATFTGSPQVCFNLPSITDSVYFNNLRVLHLESNVWTNRTGTIDFSTRTLCSAGLTSLSPFAIVYGFVPTVANAAISGRVTTANGNGIRNAIIQLTSGTGETKFARTSSFGYYKFEDLEVGQTYILTVLAKRYTFANPTRVITLNEDLTDVEFVSDGK